MPNNQTPVTESELAAQATAPRLTPDTLQAQIASEHFFTAYDGVTGGMVNTTLHQVDHTGSAYMNQSLGLLTLCILVMRNGFTIVGKSACASPENFNAELGRRLAREDAVRQLWPILGYELRTMLAEKATPTL